jgi:hypothetical protein
VAGGLAGGAGGVVGEPAGGSAGAGEGALLPLSGKGAVLVPSPLPPHATSMNMISTLAESLVLRLEDIIT